MKITGAEISYTPATYTGYYYSPELDAVAFSLIDIEFVSETPITEILTANDVGTDIRTGLFYSPGLKTKFRRTELKQMKGSSRFPPNTSSQNQIP